HPVSLLVARLAPPVTVGITPKIVGEEILEDEGLGNLARQEPCCAHPVRAKLTDQSGYGAQSLSEPPDRRLFVPNDNLLIEESLPIKAAHCLTAQVPALPDFPEVPAAHLIDKREGQALDADALRQKSVHQNAVQRRRCPVVVAVLVRLGVDPVRKSSEMLTNN